MNYVQENKYNVYWSWLSRKVWVELLLHEVLEEYLNSRLESELLVLEKALENPGPKLKRLRFDDYSTLVYSEDGEYCEPQSFFSIKQWFLNEFPEFKQIRKDYRQKIVSIYDAAAAKSVA